MRLFASRHTPITEMDDLDRVTTSRPARRRLWLAVALTVLLVVVTGLLSGPSPPRKIVMAGGQAGGVYTAVAHDYRERLSRVGLDVRVVETNGSLDNLERLLRHDVDVGLVQGGTSALVSEANERLRGLAALYFEPLWVFHRDSGVTSLQALRGRRVSVGLPRSGTEAVARTLLREYGVEGGPLVVNLSNVEARERLERGELDAAFFVTSYRDPMIVELLQRRDVHLLSFGRDAAHARRFPALQPLKFPEGVIDLQRNIPPADKTLLAPAALLVSRADLHPRVVEQLLKVAHAVHRPGSLLDPPGRFPSLEGLDLPAHEAAEVYLTQGESLLSRTLPYPLLRWLLILRLLVLPLIIWLPIVRLWPEVSNWKTDRHLGRLYGILRKTEQAVAGADRPEQVREQISRLDRLATSTAALCRKVPPSRQRDVYHWRLHIGLVRADATARLAELTARDSEKPEARSA